ncbi:hypothetical protein SARC_04029, partial [Sphaeroforma arctica JP610]
MALGLRSQATATAIAMAGGNKVGTTLQTMGDSIETIGSSTNPKQLSAKAKAFATYTYKAEQPGALSFTAGSIITIMDKDTPNADLGYWYGCTQDGKTGYFPYSMVYELNHPTPSPMSIDHYIQLQGAGLAIVKYTTLESEVCPHSLQRCHVCGVSGTGQSVQYAGQISSKMTRDYRMVYK